jgi:hypothetical protein
MRETEKKNSIKDKQMEPWQGCEGGFDALGMLGKG